MDKMNGRDLFGAAVRIIGLLVVLRGFLDYLYVVGFEMGVVKSSISSPFPYTNLLIGTFCMFSGFYLLRGAPSLVNFAYPKELSNLQNQPEKLAETDKTAARLNEFEPHTTTNAADSSLD